MMPKQNLILLIGLTICNATVAGDEFPAPIFRQLINKRAAFSNIIFEIYNIFPKHLNTATRERIVETLPGIEMTPGTLEGPANNFIHAVQNQLSTVAMQRATVRVIDLKKDSYRQRYLDDKKTFKLCGATEDGEDTKIYWQDQVSKVFYDLEKEVEEKQIGYDADKIRTEISTLVAPILSIVRQAEAEQIKLEQDAKYTGRSRHVLSSCPEKNLAFHSNCIRKWVDNTPRCPGFCGKSMTRKDVKFRPAYKAAEDCAICLGALQPAASVATSFNAKKRPRE